MLLWRSSLKFYKFLFAILFLFPGWARADSGIGFPSLFEQGAALLKAKAYHLALDRFFLAGKLSRDDAERAEALRWTGEAHLRNRQFDSACHDFLTALRLDPLSSESSATEFKTAIALIYGKKYDASLEHLSHLEKESADLQSLSDVYFWEAECHYQLGQYPDALKLYQNILSQNPNYSHAPLVNYLVDWCYFQQKDFDKAYAGFNDLASTAKDEKLVKLSVFQAAECQFWLGNYQDAQDAYDQFIKTYEGDAMEADAYYGWGWCLAKRGKHLEAAKTFKKIVANFPKNPLAPWATVRQGAEDFAGGDNDAARADYEKGLTLCGGKTPADYLLYGIAWLDYSEQNFDDAVEGFNKVEKFDPQSSLYWNAIYLQAGCRYLQGKYDEAKKIYDGISDPAPQELTQDATYWDGWCDYAIGQYDSALKEFLFIAQNTQAEIQTRGYWGAAETSYQMGQYAKAAGYYGEAVKNNPTGDLAGNCYSGLGWAQFQQEKYTEALQAFKTALEKNPGSPLESETLLRIADSYYNLHDYPEAAENYQKAVAKNAGSPNIDAEEQLGWCSYHLEEFDKAVSIWGGLLEKDKVEGHKSKLLYWSAWAYFREKDYNHAQQLFQQIETDYPSDPLAPESHLREGDCFFNLKQFKDAKDIYQSFIDTYPAHALMPDALYGLQWSAEKLGLRDEASQAAKNFLKSFPGSAFAPSIQYRLGDTFFQNKKYSDAIEAFHTLLLKYPDCVEAPKALFWMATALVKSDKKNDAMDSFNDLLKKYPDDPLALEGQFSLASLYFDAGDFKNALDNYKHIFKNNPTHHLASRSLYNSAVCEKETGNPGQALDYFEKLANDYTSDPLAAEASLQAGILLEKKNELDKALKAYEVTVKSNDRALSAEASFYHADIYKQKKDYENSIDEFNALIANYPDQDQWVVTAYAKVAECYEEQKKYSKAADTYKRILKYTKVQAFRTATLKRLKALQPFLHPRKKKVREPEPVPAPPEGMQ